MKRYHRHIDAPFELEDAGKLQARHGFEDGQQIIFVDMPVGKVLFAIRAGKKQQAIGLDFIPESLVVHWLQPFHDVVNISEFHIKTSLPDWFRAAQICPANGRDS